MKATEQFVDEAVIEIAAGRGGDGCVSFRRERYIPRGGPDGGDGGRGGDVVLQADRGLSTLLDQRLHPEVSAEDGTPGGTNGRSGKNGADCVLRVPVGTVAHEGGPTPVVDFVVHGQRFIAARGGQGGRGNSRFATPTRQAPDTAESGRPGEARRLRLSLKLIADAGLVGLPNAGKSTLLRRISAARPRVGAYPFTTLVPSLGVVEANASGAILRRRFVVADIPGLIEGASHGAGLGDRFLRHVERTRVLVHLVDVGTAYLEERGADAPFADWETIRGELASYDRALGERTEIVVLNKVDLIPDAERDARLAPLTASFAARDREVLRLSGATGEGIETLLVRIAASLERADAAEADFAADGTLR